MKLLTNLFSKIGADFFARLIGFITLPFIARALGPEGFGTYSYLFIVTSYFGFFIDFGYINYGTNKLCSGVDDKIVIEKIISLQVITAILSYVVLIITAYFIFDFYNYILLLIFSFTFISQVFAIKYYYLANNKLYYNSFSELMGQLVYACLVFSVFYKYPGVQTLIILSVLQSVTTSVFLFIPFIKKNTFKINLRFYSIFKTLREVYKLGLTSKAEQITPSFIILSIGIFLNEQSVGLYNASFKIYLILLTVIQGISYSFMPALLRSVKQLNKNNIRKISFMFYIYAISGISLFLICFFFANDIIHLVFGNKFADAAYLLKSFSATILLWPIVMFMGMVMLAFNKYNFILFTSLSSAVMSIVLSLILIKTSGIEGAGYIFPLVAIGTVIVSYYFLLRISSEENLHISEFFSYKKAYYELNIFLKTKT